MRLEVVRIRMIRHKVGVTPDAGHGALHQPRNYALRKREEDLLALWQVDSNEVK